MSKRALKVREIYETKSGDIAIEDYTCDFDELKLQMEGCYDNMTEDEIIADVKSWAHSVEVVEVKDE